MAEKQPEFQSYPSVIDDDDKLSTSATVSNSNRSSTWSVHNEIGVDDSVSPATSVIAEKLYVALGKDLKEGKPILVWALKNSGGRTICILHVHQPDELIPCMGGNFPASNADAVSVQAHRQREKQKMNKVLNEYLLICKQVEVQAETLHTELDCIEKGIVKIISENGIKRLVMGAAAKKYSRNLTDLKSIKAKYVNEQAPVTCHIWFVCKDQLIYTRQGSLGVTNVDPVPEEVQQPFPNPGTIRPDPVIARPVTLEPSTQINQVSRSSHNQYRTMPVNLHGRTVSEIYTGVGRGASTSNSKRHSEASLEEDATMHLSKYIKDRDKLQRELDDAHQKISKYNKEIEELRRERDDALQIARDFSQFFSKFSFLEIEEATRSFHPSLKIVEGDYGTIYKGLLRHTEVAIKMLHTENLQAPSEYQREVDVLSEFRHPNIVTLIGACPQFKMLIYEYVPNGSLEDRLNCKDNSPPLSWKTRIHIATELCSALAFLHSSKPHSIVHGDLKPSNILLDANFVSKLSNFGICRVVSPDEHASIEATTSYRADPQDTFAFTDPEPFLSGELTTKADVYSFGVVLLRLLTGKASVGITYKEIRNALDDGKLESVLDNLAGGWQYVQAHQLAHLALRCVEDGPDLGSEVWRVLQAMRASCEGFSSTARTDSEDSFQAPHYFLRPIFQEVMQDPHRATDRFTQRP